MIACPTPAPAANSLHYFGLDPLDCSMLGCLSPLHWLSLDLLASNPAQWPNSVLLMAGGNPLPQDTRPVWTSQAMVGVSFSATALAYAGVCLSPGSELLPAQLVSKVRSGAYIKMKALLGDNISLLSESENFNGPQHFAGLPEPQLREVSSLASWVYCFLAFLALRCTDTETREQLVHARLVVRESLWHGGQGWLAYDCIFRQQAALDLSLRWSELHPAILASTFMLTLQNAAQGIALLKCGISLAVVSRLVLV